MTILVELILAAPAVACIVGYMVQVIHPRLK
jgi:hypothetical protein